jgi:transposase
LLWSSSQARTLWTSACSAAASLKLDSPAAHRADNVDQRAATVGDFKQFKNGAQFDSWRGLVPHQHPSGGENKQGGSTQRGDTHTNSAHSRLENKQRLAIPSVRML